jgi:hypothetical protein
MGRKTRLTIKNKEEFSTSTNKTRNNLVPTTYKKSCLIRDSNPRLLGFKLALLATEPFGSAVHYGL